MVKTDKLYGKIVAVANFLDQKEQYELASSLTQILKNAQIWDAIFNPSSVGLEGASLWERLKSGFGGNKTNRMLGLVMSLNNEAEKANKTIKPHAESIENFLKQFEGFYKKLYESSEYKSTDLKEDLASLKPAINQMVTSLSSKQLHKALDLRNKVNTQRDLMLKKLNVDPSKKEQLLNLSKPEQEQKKKEKAKEQKPTK